MFVCLFACLFVCLSVNFFSVKDFSATIRLWILKFSTKLESDELCNKVKATYCSSVPLFVQCSSSPMEISVTEFSAPIEANVLKCYLHLQVDKMYCINENYDANPHFTFFFNFSSFPSVTLI